MSANALEGRLIRTDRYWAMERDPVDLVAALHRKRRMFWDLLEESNTVSTAYKLWRFYHGKFYDEEGGRIVLGGQHLDISQLGVNEFRARLRLLLTYATSTEPEWDTHGTDTSQDTLEGVKIANDVMDWTRDDPRYQLGKCFRKAAEEALIFRAGYVATLWDDTAGDPIGKDPEVGHDLQYQYLGDLNCFNLTIFDSIFDPTVPYRRRTWVLLRERRNKWDLAEIYFAQRKDIERVTDREERDRNRFYGMERGLVQSQQDEDVIDKWHFFHLPTPALPSGRYTCFVGKDVVLRDGGYPSFYDRDRLPISRTVHSDMLGTDVIGHSPAVDLAPLQEALNIQISTILTNHRKFGQVKLWAETGDDLSPQHLEPGSLLLRTHKEIKVLDLLKTSPELMAMVDQLIVRMDSVSGVAAASRGFASKEASGIRAALDDQKTIEANSDFDANIKQAAQESAQTVLGIWQEKAGDGREMPVLGENDQMRIQKFTSGHLRRVKRIMVKPGNPMLRTASGRIQYAEWLLPLGLISNEKEIVSILQGAPIRRLTSPEEAQMRLAHEAAEKIKRGEMVVPSLTDDHLLNIKVITSEVLGSMEGRMNPMVAKNASAKVLWHLEQLVMNPMAQALMVALNWAPPERVMALAQIGSLMQPMIGAPAGAGGSPDDGKVLQGPGSEGPVQGAQGTLNQARRHLQEETSQNRGPAVAVSGA